VFGTKPPQTKKGEKARMRKLFITVLILGQGLFAQTAIGQSEEGRIAALERELAQKEEKFEQLAKKWEAISGEKVALPKSLQAKEAQASKAVESDTDTKIALSRKVVPSTALMDQEEQKAVSATEEKRTGTDAQESVEESAYDLAMRQRKEREAAELEKLRKEQIAKKKKRIAAVKKKRGGKLLAHIDLSKQRMYIYRGGKLLYKWPVSTARRGYVTPRGTYRPQFLERMHYSRRYHNSPMPHSIFFHGNFAIHGTYSIRRLGRRASHGCVRLHPKNARTLYSMVRKFGKRNTIIKITD
jgi:lipoprotein-anchoring transpeptidase ErfK/SrfK